MAMVKNIGNEVIAARGRESRDKGGRKEGTVET